MNLEKIKKCHLKKLSVETYFRSNSPTHKSEASF